MNLPTIEQIERSIKRYGKLRKKIGGSRKGNVQTCVICNKERHMSEFVKADPPHKSCALCHFKRLKMLVPALDISKRIMSILKTLNEPKFTNILMTELLQLTHVPAVLKKGFTIYPKKGFFFDTAVFFMNCLIQTWQNRTSNMQEMTIIVLDQLVPAKINVYNASTETYFMEDFDKSSEYNQFRMGSVELDKKQEVLVDAYLKDRNEFWSKNIGEIKSFPAFRDVRAKIYTLFLTDLYEGKNVCYLCGGVASYECSKCKEKYYCSKECQKLDWTFHSPNCHKAKK